MRSTAETRLIFVCSPSLGILDNWLPVLFEYRARNPQAEMVAILPLQSTIRSVIDDDTAIVIAEDLFDKVIFLGVTGKFVAADGFGSARRLAEREWLSRFIQRVMDRVGARLGWRWIHQLSRTLETALLPRSSRINNISIASLYSSDAVLCYDVYTGHKPSVVDVLRPLAGVPRFSLLHGLDLVSNYGEPAQRPHPEDDVVAYLYSESERDSYRFTYGLGHDRTKVVGIPRHDTEWMKRVVEVSKSLHELPWDDVVFLISRPPSADYLPFDRKVSALKDIYQVICEELDLRLVVKMHPKEEDRGEFELAFPPGTEGRTWMRTRAHPFHVGTHSKFAIAFWSGVPLDMLTLGVPTIERLDLRGLEKYDNSSAIRDGLGNPAITLNRQHGLVLPADDAQELRRQTNRIMENRDAIVAESRQSLSSLFASSQGAIALIVQDLMSINNQNRE